MQLVAPSKESLYDKKRFGLVHIGINRVYSCKLTVSDADFVVQPSSF